jgi:hypothetical protein
MVTVSPSVQTPVNSGVVFDVMLSLLDVPVSVAALMSGAPSVPGACVSMVMVKAGDALPVLSARSVAVTLMVWSPSSNPGETVKV